MSDDFWTLTEDQYFRLVDERTSALNRRLKERWRMAIEGIKQKPSSFDLRVRDFPSEKLGERDDWEAYDIMETELDRRKIEIQVMQEKESL